MADLYYDAVVAASPTWHFRMNNTGVTQTNLGSEPGSQYDLILHGTDANQRALPSLLPDESTGRHVYLDGASPNPGGYNDGNALVNLDGPTDNAFTIVGVLELVGPQQNHEPWFVEGNLTQGYEIGIYNGQFGITIQNTGPGLRTYYTSSAVFPRDTPFWFAFVFRGTSGGYLDVYVNDDTPVWSTPVSVFSFQGTGFRVGATRNAQGVWNSPAAGSAVQVSSHMRVQEIAAWGRRDLTPAQLAPMQFEAGKQLGTIPLGRSSFDIRSVIYWDLGASKFDVEHTVFQAYGAGIAGFDIEHQITKVAGRARFDVEHQITSVAAPTGFDVEHTIEHPTGRTGFDVQHTLYAVGAASFDVAQGIYDPAIIDAQTRFWRAYVYVGNVDLSAAVTGALRVEAEEGSARIAEIELQPETGPVDLADWTGAPVTIEYAIIDAQGNDLARWRLFTGVVDEPRYDPVSRIMSLACTDFLQGFVDSMSRSQILTFVNGYWSNVLFSDDVSNWEFMLDCVSTIPYAVDLDVNSVLRRTPWAAKATPDLLLTDDQIVDTSPTVQITNHRRLVNEITLNLSHRFTRLWHREHVMGWHLPGTMCDYLVNAPSLPSKSMIRSAVWGGDWQVRYLNHDELPPSGLIQCSDGGMGQPGEFAWINNNQTLSRGFRAHLIRRWSQSITDAHLIRIRAPESIAKFAAVNVGSQLSYTSPQLEAQDWLSKQYADPDDPSTYEDVTTVGFADPDAGFPAGTYFNAYGDRIYDDADPAEFGNAYTAAIERETVRILATHRRNRARAQIALAPGLDRDHTVEMNVTGLHAKGKVWRIVHTMEIDSHVATTDVTIAISKASGVGLLYPEGPHSPPRDVMAQVDETPLVDAQTKLDTNFGGRSESPPHNDLWTGYSGNYLIIPPGTVLEDGQFNEASIVVPGTERYPYRLRLPFPGVDEAHTSNQESQNERSISVAIPDDTFEMTA